MTIVLNGYEIWFLTPTEEPRLMVFENRVLSKISGPKREDATADWGKNLHREEFNLCCLPDIAWVIK